MPTEPTRRIELSRRNLAAWEAKGAPGGRPEDNLRMIRQELQILAALAADHPRLADSVREVSARYGVMANRIRLGTS